MTNPANESITEATATIVLSDAGQEMELAIDLCREDATLRHTLQSWYPELATAQIARMVTNGKLTCTVTKRAGPKGLSSLAARLAALPEWANPALQLMLYLDDLDLAGHRFGVVELIRLQPTLEAAIRDGDRESTEITDIVGTLNRQTTAEGEQQDLRGCPRVLPTWS